MPVASFHSCARRRGQRLAGRYALAQARQVELRGTARAIARYDVGAVNRTVAAVSRRSPAAALRRTPFPAASVAAPTRSGNSSRPPSPNVKRQRRTAGEDVIGASRAAWSAASNRSRRATSRWKCIVPFGLAGRPGRERDQRGVVGGGVDIRRMRAGLSAARASTPSGAAGLEMQRRVVQRRTRCARGIELRGEPRIAQRVRDLRLGDDVGQFLGAQAAASSPPRRRRPSSPRTSTPPSSGCSVRATARGCRERDAGPRRARARSGWPAASSSAYVQRSQSGARIAVRSPQPRSTARSSSSTAQLSRVRIAQFRQVEDRVGPLVARRQVIARERVDVRR